LDAPTLPLNKKPSLKAEPPPAPSSDSEGSSASDADVEITGEGPAEPTSTWRLKPQLALLPSEVSTDDVQTCLVQARLTRPWSSVEKLQAVIPPHYRESLYTGENAVQRTRKDYDKTLLACLTGGPQRKDPNAPFFPHRPSFTFIGDKNLGMDGRNVSLLCNTERMSDFANTQISLVTGGSRELSDFAAIIAGAWAEVTNSSSSAPWACPPSGTCKTASSRSSTAATRGSGSSCPTAARGRPMAPFPRRSTPPRRRSMRSPLRQ